MKKDVVELEYWMAPDSLESYVFVNNWKTTNDKLGDAVTFRPRYKFRNLSEKTNFDFLESHCVSQGNYCVSDDRFGKPLSVIKEGLRQICLWEQDMAQNTTIWWAYVSEYQGCLKRRIAYGEGFKGDQDCYDEIRADFQYIGSIHEDLELCIKNSYSESQNTYLSSNSYLEEHANPSSYEGLYLVPAVFVEKRLVKGDLSSMTVLSGICEILNSKPEVCEVIDFLKAQNRLEQSFWSKLTLGVLLQLLGCCFLVVLVVLYIIGTYESDRINEEISSDIKTHVTEYLKLKEIESSISRERQSIEPK